MKIYHCLLASAACLVPTAVLAQDIEESGQEQVAPQAAAEIIVTGSRAITNGEQAPTPVTVLSTDQLKNTAPNLSEALRQIPQLTASGSPATPDPTIGGGPSTQNTPNLRNLGANRTLTLLDGRRPAIFGGSGLVDAGVFPQSLIKRVDIVTGGASSAYGSDAIAGVVNYIIDTDYQGLTAEARGGISSRGDAESYAFEIAGGTELGDRTHLVASLNYANQALLMGDERSWGRLGAATVPNPNAGQPGEPNLLFRDDVTVTYATFGGRVLTSPLNNIQFDADGNAIPYSPGSQVFGSTQIGGDGVRYAQPFSADTENYSGYAHLKHELSDRVSIFAEGIYGHAKSSSPNLYAFNLGGGAYQVQRDNAYLPDDVAALMDANNLSTIAVGKLDRNYGRNVTFFEGDTYSGTIGLDASLWGNWELDVYGSHSTSKTNFGARNNRYQARSRLATDAVLDGGQIVCRSTLTDPTNGCVPINPLGEAPLTDEQRAYLTGVSQVEGTTKQTVAAASMFGDLFEGWAGPVSAAVGAEYRKVSLDQTADPTGQAFGWTAGNLSSSSGSYDVKEAFAEVQVPLLVDAPLARDLSVNGAIRRTTYSASGSVTTWKVGLTNEVFDGFRIRASLSQDIRAPNINELFGGVVRSITTINDPVFNGQNFINIFTFAGSNDQLRPEKAKTLTAGFVYRPEFAPGLGVSVDYYRIKLSDSITQVGFQTVVDQCFAGNQLFCDLITRDSNNELVEINAPLQNVASGKVSGVDFEVNYATQLGAGDLSLRGIGTYLDQYQFSNPGAPTVEQAGTPGLPRWRANLAATYSQGGLTVSVQERFIGKTTRVVLPVTVDDNSVSSTFYTNATVRYQFENDKLGSPEVFLNVNNLFDQKPRIGRTNSLGLGFNSQYDGSLYDVIGRYFNVGVRVRY